jgi:hypothetical protein
MDQIDYTKLKESLGIDSSLKVTVKPISGGFKIMVGRNHRQAKSLLPLLRGTVRLYWFGSSYTHKCIKCNIETDDLHYHHIVFRSAGGLDDPDNLLPLCFDCHVGNNAIHNNKWDISSVVDNDKLMELRMRYNVKHT